MSAERQYRPTGQAWTMARGSGQVPARMRTRSEIMAARRAERAGKLTEVAYAVATGCTCSECRVDDVDRPEPATVPELEVKRAAGGRVALVDFRPVAIVEASPYADCWGEGR